MTQWQKVSITAETGGFDWVWEWTMVHQKKGCIQVARRLIRTNFLQKNRNSKCTLPWVPVSKDQCDIIQTLFYESHGSFIYKRSLTNFPSQLDKSHGVDLCTDSGNDATELKYSVGLLNLLILLWKLVYCSSIFFTRAGRSVIEQAPGDRWCVLLLTTWGSSNGTPSQFISSKRNIWRNGMSAGAFHRQPRIYV